MAGIFAHITPLEAPVVWLAFVAGLVLGIAGTWSVLSKKRQRAR